jgi:hypothetical protein
MEIPSRYRTGGVGFRRYRRNKVCFLTVPGA